MQQWVNLTHCFYYYVMNELSDMYVTLPDNSKVCLYKRHGLLIINNEKIKIHKDIAYTILLCLNGTSLYNAILICCSGNNQKAKKILLGVLKLIAENKLLVSKDRKESKHIIVVNEEYVSYPQSLHVELTRACNLNCYYCYNNSGPNIKERLLSTETLLDVIRELSERGLAVVELTGGEPLLHPDFIKILNFCCDHLNLVSILSNGTLIDDHFVEKIIHLKNKIIFSISLDSYLANEHERKSGVVGSFQRTVNAIRVLSKQKFIVRVSMAVDDKNWKQIEKTLLFAKSIGATKFTYSPIIPVGRGGSNGKQLFGFDTPFDEVIKYEKYLMNNYSDFLHILDGYSQQELNSQGGCGAGSRSFVLSPQGIIRMCASFKEGRIGDITTQSLKEIFSNQLCKLSAQIVPPSYQLCKDCHYFSFCVGCSFRAMKGIEDIGVDNCSWLNNSKIVKEWFCKIM